jgi:glycosyltransferase involved in cell wall biosynthesis
MGYGGIETCVQTIAEALHKHKKNFFVVAPKHSEKNVDYPYQIFRTKSGPTSETKKSSSSFAWESREIIEREKPDVIWSQSNWSADCLWDLGIPIICTFHDACQKMFGWIKKYPNVKYRFLSQFSYDVWVTEKWEADRSFVQYSGLADEDYVFYPEERRGDHALWVAGLQWGLHAKGLDFAINCAKMGLNVLAYGAGNPQLEDFCRKTASEVESFRYGGNLLRGLDHTNAFGSCKCFLMPTRTLDTFPRTVLEAMSKGTPVFGFDNGAIKEMVGTDGGFVCKEEKLSSLNIIEGLTSNKNYSKVFEWSKRYHVDNEIEKLISESNVR